MTDWWCSFHSSRYWHLLLVASIEKASLGVTMQYGTFSMHLPPALFMTSRQVLYGRRVACVFLLLSRALFAPALSAASRNQTAASDDDIFKLSSCTVPSFPTNNEVMHNGNALLVGKRLVYFTVIFQFL